MTPSEAVDISADVLFGIAQLALDKVEAVTAIAPPAKVGEILSRRRAKGIRIDREENRVRIHLTVRVRYGSKIPKVAAEAQGVIREAIESMTGLEVEEVAVIVESIDLGEDLAGG